MEQAILIWSLVGLIVLTVALGLSSFFAHRQLKVKMLEVEESAALNRSSFLDQEAQLQAAQAQNIQLEARLTSKQELEQELRQRLLASEQALSEANQEQIRMLEKVTQADTALKAEALHHKDKLALLEQTKAKLSETFKVLAGDIF